MHIHRFTYINSTNKFTNIIYNNFKYLQNQSGIEFSKNTIIECLTSSELLGWYLLDNNNNIIGYLIGTKKEVGDGRYVFFIDYFYIITKYRNNGFGTKMLMICINYIKSINIKFIMLITEINSNAHKMYNKIGFIREPLITLNNINFWILLYYID